MPSASVASSPAGSSSARAPCVPAPTAPAPVPETEGGKSANEKQNGEWLRESGSGARVSGECFAPKDDWLAGFFFVGRETHNGDGVPDDLNLGPTKVTESGERGKYGAVKEVARVGERVKCEAHMPDL
jgi:hypothetical protein